MDSSDESVTWASYALVAAAVIYTYDFIITTAAEVQAAKIRHSYFLHLVPLRYFGLFYQIAIMFGIFLSRSTPKL
ncbi:hypothetical protein B0H14DRAFT_976359 [Mycena olivaceomarginata]|nr:hypothetical protein B0H14DRAFT_976359 [Mycena olivaceomarginata]